MQPRFVAARKDGLGCRLTALVNAIALADDLDGTFEFSWPENRNIRDFHSIWPAEAVFSPAFVADHRSEDWSEKFDMMQGNGPRNRAYAAHVLTAGDLRELFEGTAVPREFWLMGLDDFGDILGRDWASRLYPAAFDRIEFVPAIVEAMDLARKVDVGEEACALHLRGGDVVFAMRFSNQYTRKAIPFALAAEIGRRASAAGLRVFVFGQERAVIDHVAEFARGVSVYALVERHGFDELQSWFFETVLMARCSRIIAGNSGFSTVAAQIAGRRVRHGYAEFGARAALSTTFDDSVERAAVPDLHKAFAYWSVQEVYGNDLSGAERLECLRRALIHDPTNSFYRLARVTVLTELGNLDAARAALRDLVDAETASVDWSEGCLRHTLVNLRGQTRATAKRYLTGIDRLAAGNVPEAILCKALLATDKQATVDFCERFHRIEGETARARFYALALANAIKRYD